MILWDVYMVVEGNMDMGKVFMVLYCRVVLLLLSMGNIVNFIVVVFYCMVYLWLLVEIFEELESMRFVWEE